jgi:hypothetical protein
MCEIFVIFGGNMSELFNPEIEVTKNVFPKVVLATVYRQSLV